MLVCLLCEKRSAMMVTSDDDGCGMWNVEWMWDVG
jgi:hypothetical protein